MIGADVKDFWKSFLLVLALSVVLTFLSVRTGFNPGVLWFLWFFGGAVATLTLLLLEKSGLALGVLAAFGAVALMGIGFLIWFFTSEFS